MLWPWVSRNRLRECRRRCRAVASLRIAAAEGRAEELKAALVRSENERNDLQVKLLQAGFGINPFHEVLEKMGPAPVPPESAAAPTQEAISDTTHGMSEEGRRNLWVRKGQQMYGNNLRKIARYVEQQEESYYVNGRYREPILSEAEVVAAQNMAADLAAAIEEGRRNAPGVQ